MLLSLRQSSNKVKNESKKFDTLLDLCVSSLRRGHANLLYIVPILSDDPRRESSRKAFLAASTISTFKPRFGRRVGCRSKVYFLIEDVNANVNSGLMPVTLELGRRCKLHLPGSCMLMALPSQAGKPQGHCGVKHGVLVDNVSGTGRGWQQSRSN